MSGYYEISGAIHVHSKFSDGTQGIPEIAAIASTKGLDFVMFSDHHTLEPKKKGLEGWYEKVLALIGYEINDPDNRNHYLAFRLDHEIEPGLNAEGYVRQVKDHGGFGIIAHPCEKRDFSEAYPPYPWTAWDTDAFDGIEIWNQLSEWIEGVTRLNFLWRVLHPLRSIRFPVWETLNRWDTLNLYRRVVGVGGIDVHAFRHKLFGFIPVKIYPYKVHFKSIRTHLMIEAPLISDMGQRIDFKTAEGYIFDALNNARCFIVNHSLGSGKGFQFWAESWDERFEMGSRVRISTEHVRFHVSTPRKALIRCIHNGQLIQESVGNSFQFKPVQQGVYRIEVFRKNRGWIYSNPIVLL